MIFAANSSFVFWFITRLTTPWLPYWDLNNEIRIGVTSPMISFSMKWEYSSCCGEISPNLNFSFMEKISGVILPKTGTAYAIFYKEVSRKWDLLLNFFLSRSMKLFFTGCTRFELSVFGSSGKGQIGLELSKGMNSFWVGFI